MKGMATFLAACCWMVAGCGDQLAEARRLFMGAPAIVMAAVHEIESRQAIPLSYLVAFRTELPGGGLRFSSYREESRAHFGMMLSWVRAADGIADMRYITGMDLNSIPSAGLPKGVFSPLEQRLFWGRENDEAKGATFARVDFRSAQHAEATLKKWEREGRIWYAEPNYLSRPFGAEVFTNFASTYSGLASRVSWYSQIKLPEAFTFLATQDIDLGNVPLIAVMDSGTDYKHQALASNVWQNDASTVGKAGCHDDTYGCNATQADKGSLGNGDVFPAGTSAAGSPCDDAVEACPHGTHVAGLVAATPQSDYGGGCPVCKIMTVKVVGKTKSSIGSEDENTIADSSLIAGFAYVSKFMSNNTNAVRVINASFGKSQRSRTVELLIRLLKSQGSGTMVIAAAGNEDTMLRQYPAAYQDVIAVANINADSGVKHPSSNFGPWVDIAAPGSSGMGGISSSVPGDQELPETGTSMSTPVVTGIAGLLLLQKPSISINELRQILIGSADASLYQTSDNQPYIQKVQGSSTAVPLLGAGILNAENAVKRIMPEHVGSAVMSRVSANCGMLGGGAARCALPVLLLFGWPVIALFIKIGRR